MDNIAEGDKWKTESIIDMNDPSGEQFLSMIVDGNPPLFDDYMVNAQRGGCYDFKSTNGTPGTKDKLNPYRGMPMGETSEGLPVIASARDIGNIAAGYIAAANGLSWVTARIGFDTYQSIDSRGPAIEGMSTMKAELYGFVMGYKKTPLSVRPRIYNVR